MHHGPQLRGVEYEYNGLISAPPFEGRHNAVHLLTRFILSFNGDPSISGALMSIRIYSP